MTHLIPLSPSAFEPGDRMIPSRPSADHCRGGSNFHFVLSYYAVHTPGIQCLANPTWIILGNAVQPDVTLHIRAEFGGRTTDVKGYASGAPELAVEISKSTRSYDLGLNLALYQRAGVPEYVAALVQERRIEWRLLEEGSYQLMPPPADGIYRSQIFPGLWLDSSAFWRNDTTALIELLEQGLRSEEYDAFVEKLKSFR